MDLRDYMRIVRKRWRLIATCTVLALAAAIGVTLVSTPQYQAEAQLFVSTSSSASDLSSLLQGGNFAQQRVKSYADIVTSPQVTRPVISKLGLDLTPDELAKKIDATNPLDTVLLNIDVTDASATRARDLANAVAAQFTDVVKTLETPEGSQQSLVKATVVRAADTPLGPVSPRPKINLALGLLVGLAIGVGAAVLRETLDTSVKNADEVKERTGAPVLASVPFDAKTPEHTLITDPDVATGARAESYRTLRTNLSFVDVDQPPKLLVVTSALPNEGKSTTSVNLAIAMAEAGNRVVLVEADLRRPRTADYLRLEGGVGVTDVLLGQASLLDVLQPWGRLPLKFLASGAIPPNPSELLGSRQMSELLSALRQQADVVILDAPPLLPVTDAAVLAARCDGALLVCSHGSTKRDQLGQAAEALRSVGGRVLGTVINRAPTGRRSGAYEYAYVYEYAAGENSSRPRLERPVQGPARNGADVLARSDGRRRSSR